ANASAGPHPLPAAATPESWPAAAVRAEAENNATARSGCGPAMAPARLVARIRKAAQGCYNGTCIFGLGASRIRRRWMRLGGVPGSMPPQSHGNLKVPILINWHTQLN